MKCPQSAFLYAIKEQSEVEMHELGILTVLNDVTLYVLIVLEKPYKKERPKLIVSGNCFSIIW